MPRQITYAIASENGKYNQSFRWDLIQEFLNFPCRYWDIQFVRVNKSPRFWIIQSNKLNGPGWMWARKSEMKIWNHSSVNWGRDAVSCGCALLHEFCHLAGSGNHLTDPKALMRTYGGPINNYTPADANYMAPYAWKSSLRPWHEPTAMLDTFKKLMLPGEISEPVSPQLEIGCGCNEPAPTVWEKFMAMFKSNMP